jgi:hypothetical protein
VLYFDRAIYYVAQGYAEEDEIEASGEAAEQARPVEESELT